jgi:lipoprotein Spr
MSLRLTLLLCLLFSFYFSAQAKATPVHHAHPQHKKTHAKTSKNSAKDKHKKTAAKPVNIKVDTKPTKTASNVKRRTRLMNQYQNWKGTRYRLGANSHKAIDCSALTRRLYKDAFAVNLPRTTTGQLRKGSKAKRTAPRVGDLVFFKTGRVQKHVGIYIGDNRFIHASRRKGVTISQLSNPYWNNHLLAVRRVLPETIVR